jgi:hypothetical protein
MAINAVWCDGNDQHDYDINVTLNQNAKVLLMTSMRGLGKGSRPRGIGF